MARVMIRSRALLPVFVVAVPVWLVVAAFARQAAPAPDVIAIDASRPGADIAPGMVGVFFEDINFAADGGLYPERVKNRSFEFPDPLAGWTRRCTARGELTDPDRMVRSTSATRTTCACGCTRPAAGSA